jgi:hypothetical protein
MNRTVGAWAGVALATAGLWSVTVAAQTASPAPKGATAWMHVRVEEAAQSSKVSVNLPMPVVEAALKAAPETIASNGRIKIGTDKHSLSLADVRKIWQELKDTGDAELVNIEGTDETVKVARRGDLVQVRVSKPSDKEEVHVDLPVSLVDAALMGDAGSIDTKGLLSELQKRRGDIVRVTDKDSSVHIWIDESAGGVSAAR